MLFSVREVPQASTGFIPFKLLFGRQPRGLQDVAREAREQQSSPHHSVVEHVEEMRARIEKVMPVVKEHLQVRQFQPGDGVLLLIPCATSKFLATWKGPYTVVEQVGPVNYWVRQPGRRRTEQIYHINLMKAWVEPGPYRLAALVPKPTPILSFGEQLTPTQRQDLQRLVQEFTDVFAETPGHTKIVTHDIRTPTGTIVRQRPYRVPEAHRQAKEEEVQRMREMEVIEESHSPWSSPIVMVPKPDGTFRFCNDFRKLNEVSTFDGYPMPQVDELSSGKTPIHLHFRFDKGILAGASDSQGEDRL